MDQVEGQGEKRDVSRQTLVVLVVLAIIVSLLGTFTVLKETRSSNNMVYAGTQSQTAQGTVSLRIVDSNSAGAQSDVATGRVTMTIVPSN